MKRCLSIVCLACIYLTTASQPMTVVNYSPEEANDFLKKFNTKIPDSSRIDILLQLVYYNLRKDASEKADLDSAEMFINMAKEINSKQRSPNRIGSILQWEASLAIDRGDVKSGKRLAENAVKELQIVKNNEIGLAWAHMELYRSIDERNAKELSDIKNIFRTLFQRVPVMVKPEQQDSCMTELVTFYHQEMKGDLLEIKLDFLNHLIRGYKMINLKVDEFWARKEITDIKYQQGKLTEAIDELLQIAKEQKEGKYPRISFTYDLLSAFYIAGGNHDKALFYSLESIKYIDTWLDSLYLSNFYFRIAAIYSTTGSVADAINWNVRRLNYLVARKETDFIYHNIYNIASDMIKLGKPADALKFVLDKKNKIPPQADREKSLLLLALAKCYSELDKNEIAEKYCEELIKLNILRVKRKEILDDLLADKFIASFYLKTGKYDKAENFFNKVLKEQPKPRKGSDNLYTIDFHFKLDSARGNHISAIRHLQRYQQVKDSIFTVTKSKQIEDLKAKYASDQKDSLISFKEENIQLLTGQHQLQKSKLQQGAILRNISFAALGLLVIIVALLYNRYRLKQRTNEKLELQQAEIEKQNSSLHHLVNEKEWLLKEIHHRVKNNLQIVMSLLNSQSAYINNDAALTAIHDSQHRVHAMSLIHQKLYNSKNVSSINMSFYVRELVSYLRDSFDTGQRIRFDLNIELLELDVSQAVPLGLILNEAITNSIKYAFPDNRSGVISISLITTKADHYLLTISDNGIGMPVHVKDKKPGSLGMSLMAGLSEDLDGKFSIENNNGTVIRISFVHDQRVHLQDELTTSFISTN